jgi:hypothetical protein
VVFLMVGIKLGTKKRRDDFKSETVGFSFGNMLNVVAWNIEKKEILAKEIDGGYCELENSEKKECEWRC